MSENKSAEMLDGPVENHGWRVTFAGLGINLALGVLYSWSIISGGMKDAGWGWTQFQLSLPYSIANQQNHCLS